MTDSGAAAARHPPRRSKLSSTRVRTETVEAPTSRQPNRHHLLPIHGAGLRGPAPSGRTSPPFPSQQSERERQRSTRAPTRQKTVHSARLLPPSRRHRPVRRRGDGTLRTRPGEPQQTSKLNRGWGDEPLKAPPPERRV